MTVDERQHCCEHAEHPGSRGVLMMPDGRLVCPAHPSAEDRALVRDLDKRGRAVGMTKNSDMWMSWADGLNWPYGPNIDVGTRLAMVEWAETNKVSYARNQRCCLEWLRTSRCSSRRGTVAAMVEHQSVAGWRDHLSSWVWAGTNEPAVLVAQPYEISPGDREELNRIASIDDLRVQIEETGWYGQGGARLGSQFIGIWRTDNKPVVRAPRSVTPWPKAKVVPSGAVIEVDSSNRAVNIDRITCEEIAPWTDPVCDALSRLTVAATVRRRPREKHLMHTKVDPTTVFVHLDYIEPADRAELGRALEAADAGDAAPADALAERWFTEWPRTCGWRFDIAYELWRAASEPSTVTELWKRLRENPCATWLRRKDVERELWSADHEGYMKLLDEDRWVPASQSRWVRQGPEVPYDPLLLRRSRVKEAAG